MFTHIPCQQQFQYLGDLLVHKCPVPRKDWDRINHENFVSILKGKWKAEYV